MTWSTHPVQAHMQRHAFVERNRWWVFALTSVDFAHARHRHARVSRVRYGIVLTLNPEHVFTCLLLLLTRVPKAYRQTSEAVKYNTGPIQCDDLNLKPFRPGIIWLAPSSASGQRLLGSF